MALFNADTSTSDFLTNFIYQSAQQFQGISY